MKSETLRVAVLASHRAPGLESLLAHPLHGDRFEVVCVVTSEAAAGASVPAAGTGVRCITHDILEFHAGRKAKLSDRAVRREYDAITVGILRLMNVDAVLMLGYLYLATEVLLDAFPARVISIHDSDLTALDPCDGRRRYVGLRSTRDAILAGETETRSSVHLVTPELDAGPVLILSRPYPVAPFVTEAARRGERDIVKAYAYAQREWMMREGWGDLGARALQLLAGQKVDPYATANDLLAVPADLSRFGVYVEAAAAQS